MKFGKIRKDGKWFAWYPIKLSCDRWAWLEYVNRVSNGYYKWNYILIEEQ